MKTKKQVAVVLIADSDDASRNIAAAFLQRDDHIVLMAESGDKALKVLQEFFGKVHLVLCGMNMPEPNGLKLRSLILRHRPGTTVVLLPDEHGLGEIPADAPVLCKPFTVGELRQRIREWLE